MKVPNLREEKIFLTLFFKLIYLFAPVEIRLNHTQTSDFIIPQ